MKQLFIFISLLLGILNAETLPNTGLQQNDLGYYGEGVTFGGLAIVGEWSLEHSYLNPILNFDENGTAGERKWGDINYGVSEDGKELIFRYKGSQHYELITKGNHGCFNSNREYCSGDIGTCYHGYSLICKLKINQKNYGSASNRVTITVKAE